MADIPTDVCYRKDTGKVVAVKPAGSTWSDIERGLLPTHAGFFFSVATIGVNNDTQLAKILGTKSITDGSGNPRTVPGDDALVIEDDAKQRDWLVDDVNAPTKLKQRKDP